MNRYLFATLSAVALALLLPACDEGAVEADPPPIGFTLRNPLVDGEPGEWALLEAPDGRTYQWELLEVNMGTRSVLYREVIRSGELNEILEQGERTAGFNHFLYGFQSGRAVIRQISNGRIEAGGRTWDAMSFEYVSGTAGVVRAWYSHEAPVLGLVKMEKVEGLKVETAYELVDWSGR